MGRSLRIAEPGLVYHALNRGNGRRTLFFKDEDYRAFERVLEEAQQRTPTRLLAYCLMPNHWHMVLWPEQPRQLSRFLGWLTLTHAQRWHAHYHNVGTGHLYQGRFKSFPVEEDNHLLAVCRYVERNALRAGLVARAEDWPWSSLWRRTFGPTTARGLLTAWPVACPERWLEHINAPETETELKALRRCMSRGQPFGGPAWTRATAERLKLSQTLRPRGRPRKRRTQPGSAGEEPSLF